jgi:hypothetical protein
MGAHRSAVTGAFAPRPREDLEVHERAEGGQQVFVVKDPALARYHQLGPSAYALLELLETEDLPESELQAALRERYGLALGRDEIVKILRNFAELGLFEITPGRAAARGESAATCARLARLRGSDPSGFARLQRQLLKRWQPLPPLWARIRRLRLRLVDPQPLLRRLEPVGRALLTARSAIVVGLLALVALVVALENRERLATELASAAGHPLFFLAIALGVTALHELGHGLACHVYGGDVRDLGVMLMYLVIPAAYCDVSDAHLIDSRSRRAVVALAGCYVNVIAWIAATFAWRLFEPDLLVTRVALVVIAVTGMSLFLNLNPLLPFDGYYALEELLGVRNLRTRGRRGGLYRLYAVASVSYTAILVPLVVLRLGGFLIERFRLAGFVATCALGALLLAPLATRGWRWLAKV